MGNIIAIFSGNVENIPKRWKLCNGQDNTPDLTDRFIKGAAGLDVGQTGGSATHLHIVAEGGFSHSHVSDGGGAHTHGNLTMDDGTYYRASHTDDRSFTERSHSHQSSISGSSHAHDALEGPSIPRFYSLAFIIAERYEFNFPVGSIVMWSGAVDELPPGFVFCDGQNGTPDLRGKFIMGTRDYVGKQGDGLHSHGLADDGEHSHSSNTVSFSHSHPRGNEGENIFSTGIRLSPSNGPAHDHILDMSGGHSHGISEVVAEPPYMKLAYIKRIA